MGSGTAIVRAIKKYGTDNFKKEILEYCDSYEDAFAKEGVLVTPDFLLRSDVYNLKCGGIGGWNHINNVPVEERTNVKSIRQQIASGELIAGGSTHWIDSGRLKVQTTARLNQPSATIKALSLESRQKRKETFAQIGHSRGEKNSQFGKIWISNILTKEVSRITINDIIPEGWVRGKKGHVPKKMWVTNGITEHYILLGNEQEYLINGFIGGRLK